jgi:hypothetical protein
MSSSPRKLRFAVMIQNEYLKKWQCDVIDNLCRSGYAESVLSIKNDGSYSNFKQPIWDKIIKLNVLWRLYEKIFLRKGPLKNIKKPKFLRKVPEIKCKVEIRGKFSQYFSDNDIEKIRSFEPDFILRFGFSIIRGEVLNVAPYGIWSFHHSDENVIRGGPAGFWEVYRMHYLNGVILQKLTDHLDGGIILKKRFYKTQFHDCAFHLHHILDASTDMPVQVCADILNGCADYFKHSASVSMAKIYSWPTAFQMISFAFRQIFRRIRYHLKDVFVFEKWSVAIAEADPDSVIRSGKLPDPDEMLLYRSDNKYPADPFALQTDNGLRIFFEDYSYSNGKAALSTILYHEGSLKNMMSIPLETGHYSFPFVFEWEGEIYVMPEQISKACVELYRWDEEGNTLTYFKTILPIPLADPVLLFEHNMWWLFGSVPGKDVNNSLNLYYSESLLTEFKPHPQNSIVFDPRCARMAGAIFRNKGKLFRPAQESHIYYGKRIALYEITQLTPTRYSERFVNHIEPNKHKYLKKGLHTLNFIPPNIVYDGKINVFSHRGFLLKLRQKILKPRF